MTPEQQTLAWGLARGIAGMTTDPGVRALAEQLVAVLGAVAVDTTKTPSVPLGDARPSEVSAHPEAVRSRRRRASRSQTAKQLELVPVATGRDRSETAAPSLSQDPDPPPTLNKIRKGSPPAPVAYDPDRPPVWLLAMAPEIRTDLAEWDLRDMWRSFCDVIEKRGFGHKDERDLREHLKNWLRREDREKRAASRESYRTAKAETGGVGGDFAHVDDGPEASARSADGRLSASPSSPSISDVEPLELPDDVVYTPKPAELARARLRALPPAMLAGAMRSLPAELEVDFGDLFPFATPEPRSMSA